MTNSLVGDNQVAVVDVDGGPEGGKSRDFFKMSASILYSEHCLIKSWRSDNSKYKISHPPPRHSFGPEFWNVAPPFIGCLFTGQVRCTHVCPTWHLAPFIGSVYLNEIKQPSSQIELNQLNYLFPKTYLVHDSLNHCWHIVVTRLLTEVSHNSKVIKSFATISHPTITPSKWSRSIFDIEEDQWIMIIS